MGAAIRACDPPGGPRLYDHAAAGRCDQIDVARLGRNSRDSARSTRSMDAQRSPERLSGTRPRRRCFAPSPGRDRRRFTRAQTPKRFPTRFRRRRAMPYRSPLPRSRSIRRFLATPSARTYRVYTLCGMGPPSSGATTVFQILGMIERFDIKALGKDSPQAWHLIAEAMMLAYADREQYLGDPDFVSVPVERAARQKLYRHSLGADLADGIASANMRRERRPARRAAHRAQFQAKSRAPPISSRSTVAAMSRA